MFNLPGYVGNINQTYLPKLKIIHIMYFDFINEYEVVISQYDNVVKSLNNLNTFTKLKSNHSKCA